ncbi:MAG: prohibitin family protein, partial [Elusimicrobiota bacterium]|nr:prohibitin family protein [Elusimicrobiota bacterium]
LAVIVTLIKGIVVVPAGHRYVVFNVFGGVQEEELGEGIHVIIPYVNKVTPYDVRIQEYTMSSVQGEGRKSSPDSLWSPTKEGLQVGIDLTVLYKLDPMKVSVLHQTVGPIYESKIIRPAIRSTVRHNISNHSVMDVYSKSRKQIEEDIFDDLKREMKDTNIIVDSVKLRDVIFTDKFAESIEKKQVAQQEMERWEYVIQQRKKEKEARIVEAEGKAEAMRIISDEIARNPDIIKYNYVEKISDDVQVIVTDQQTIMDMKGMLK